jgi:hypothetical protein
MIDPRLKPEYSDSHALIIGINDFQHASPLEYAISDAETIYETLIKRFSFRKERIQLLTNKDATRSNIMSAYMGYGQSGTEIDDRILVFYAGHGVTQTGARGEIGFLVPHDGNLGDLSTLIRWDEFTYNAELIRAKHILFIMDACYGGLIFQRAMPVGSMRFLKDMLLRPVRQAITAGKADEVVADSGGPRPSHSVFTGHLLDALDGNATTDDGVLTASGVMAYVYNKVSKDIHSRQTPHYGFFDGDGDFIFEAPILGNLTKEDKIDEDLLITIPSPEIPEATHEPDTLVSTVKEYLADTKSAIKLHDVSIRHVRKYLIETSKEKFPVQGIPFSIEEFTTRLEKYNDITQDLKLLTSCLAYWGEETHQAILQKVVGRSTDQLQPESGLNIWLALRWYPIIVISYTAGIAAVAARKYDNLHSLFVTKTASRRSSEDTTELLWSLGEAILELEKTNVFKQLPGHENNYVPRSEYLFKLLQPDLDDLFFLGNEYERAFDRFEILLALANADIRNQNEKHIWGPVGRFGWKYSGRREENPLSSIIAEAKTMASSWPPLRAGFFGGSLERFTSVASEYEAIIKRLNWW